uniref:hypothetical protein n=1 Tax=Massilia scottii TaxID=3057166 RepID=UPI0035B5CF97
MIAVTLRTLAITSVMVAPACSTSRLPASTWPTDAPMSILISFAATAERCQQGSDILQFAPRGGAAAFERAGVHLELNRIAAAQQNVLPFLHLNFESHLGAAVLVHRLHQRRRLLQG